MTEHKLDTVPDASSLFLKCPGIEVCCLQYYFVLKGSLIEVISTGRFVYMTSLLIKIGSVKFTDC